MKLDIQKVIDRIQASLQTDISPTGRVQDGRLREALTSSAFTLLEHGYYIREQVSEIEIADLLIEIIETACSHIGNTQPLFLDERFFLLTLQRLRQHEQERDKLIEALKSNKTDREDAAAIAHLRLTALLNWLTPPT